MLRLSHHYIDTKFIACFLELYKLTNDHIQFQQNGSIGNPVLVQLIEKLYLQFMRTNQDYDHWFERQVIECAVSQNKSKAKIPDVEISRKPLFIGVSKRFHKKSGDYHSKYFYPISDSCFVSCKPIPIKLDVIFEHFGLNGPLNLNASNCPSSINLYTYQNGKVINDSTCPGLSSSAKIEVASEKNNFYWVLGQVPKVFKCTKHPGICSMLFKRKTDLDRHEKICKIETVVTTKQVQSNVVECFLILTKVKFGSRESVLHEIIDTGMLPSHFQTYRKTFLATFDLECVETLANEQIGDRTIKLGVQNIVSIAFASNLPNHEPIFYLRDSSEPEMAYKMVQRFILDVFKAQELLVDNIPIELKKVIKTLQKAVKTQSFSKSKTQTFRFLRFLKKYTQLPIYGFNSSKVL